MVISFTASSFTASFVSSLLGLGGGWGPCGAVVAGITTVTWKWLSPLLSTLSSKGAERGIETEYEAGGAG